MQITRFNDLSIKALRRDVEKALNDVARAHGLRVSTLGTISYSPNNLTTGKLTFAIESSQTSLDLPLSELIGKSYKHGAKIMKITGVENGKAVGRTQRGKNYLITRDQLAGMIEIL